MTIAAGHRGAGGWLAPPCHRHAADVCNLCRDAERDHWRASRFAERVPTARKSAAGRRVGDAMVTYPKTHGSGSGLAEIRAFLEDDHVHMALIVAAGGRLVTTIERPDLAATTSISVAAAKLGALIGRTAGPADPLDAATATLLREGRRRLAVVDDFGRLLGLLCLKRDGTGYCSDEGIRGRAQRPSAAEPPFSGWLPHVGARSCATGRPIRVSPSGYPRWSEEAGP